jgi:hypothetical protein
LIASTISAEVPGGATLVGASQTEWDHMARMRAQWNALVPS